MSPLMDCSKKPMQILWLKSAYANGVAFSLDYLVCLITNVILGKSNDGTTSY